jgi:hypothetical protein
MLVLLAKNRKKMKKSDRYLSDKELLTFSHSYAIFISARLG